MKETVIPKKSEMSAFQCFCVAFESFWHSSAGRIHFFLLLTFMEIQLIYNVAMVPDVRQSDSVIRYAHSHSFSAYSLFE